MFALAFMLLALATPQPPAPDPDPSACERGWCRAVTYVDWSIDVPAVDKTTGAVVHGFYFHCVTPARIRGKINHRGRHYCVLMVGELPK